MSVQRKLKALGYSSVQANIKDSNEFRKIVAWVEKNKINKCEKNYRNDLLNVQSPSWDKVFNAYLDSLKCPIASNSYSEALLDWILGLAVQLQYHQQSERYNKINVVAEDVKQVPKIIADNPLDNIDFSSSEFAEGVLVIARLLKLTPHPDPLLTLEACSKMIKARLNMDVQANPQEYIITGTAFPYQSADLGFDLGETVLNQAAKLLRLLYIRDLRNLQTSANECIVAVQSVTANPKTDTRLGKVGR